MITSGRAKRVSSRHLLTKKMGGSSAVIFGKKTSGDTERYIWEKQTSGLVTNLEIFLKNVTNSRLIIPASSGLHFRGIGTAFDTTNNRMITWGIDCAIKRDAANNTTLVFFEKKIYRHDSELDDLDIVGSADDVNEALIFKVTSKAGIDVNWKLEGNIY